ncbi:MAG TPA: hypothetical protein VMA72_09140 [Streptosporangiaceae bacterium]|nr:hypothetical protein [Streptosporangiaceae bacterium]
MIPARDSGCLHAVSCLTTTGRPSAGTDLAELVSHLYLCEGLSTYRIGAATGMDRQRVGRMLARAGVPVKPKGAGRRRPTDEDRAALDEAMEQLYAKLRLSSGEISAITGVPQRRVIDRLHARGVRMRTKGRLNREDRMTIHAETLIRLYITAGLSAADTGRLLGVSGNIVLRAAHDEGLPVRAGGPEPSRGPEIELVEALYSDPLVRHTLGRHNISPRPADGPIWQRFPVPIPVSAELAEELYVACGLGVRHIELLTGQPAQTILRLLRAQGITRRHAGGRSPFMRRWRAGLHAAPTCGHP